VRAKKYDKISRIYVFLGSAMLSMSKKVEYALMAMVEITDHKGRELITAKELAKRYHIPQEILGKVLQALSKKGLIESIQGMRGGYRAGNSGDKIPVAHIIEAIDGPIELMACNSGNFCDCEQISVCNIREPMEILQEELRTFFYNISLKDLKQGYDVLPKE
jgi:Rrf2 family protein